MSHNSLSEGVLVEIGVAKCSGARMVCISV